MQPTQHLIGLHAETPVASEKCLKREQSPSLIKKMFAGHDAAKIVQIPSQSRVFSILLIFLYFPSDFSKPVHQIYKIKR